MIDEVPVHGSINLSQVARGLSKLLGTSARDNIWLCYHSSVGGMMGSRQG